jgi:twinkle protein
MYTWSDFDIDFDPMEHEEELSYNSLFLQCPKCNSKRKNHSIPTLYIDYHQQGWFCKHCGFAGNLLQGRQHIPQEKINSEPWSFNPFLANYEPQDELSSAIIDNFKKRKISEQTIRHFKIAQAKVYFPALETEIPCVVYPYYQEQRLANLVYFYGTYRSSEIGGVKTCFNYDQIDTEHTYIVMDEMEVLSFYECGISNVISLFGGYSITPEINDAAKNTILEFLSSIEDRIAQIKKLTLALPNNPQGNIIKDELLRRFGKERCWIVQPPENDYNWNRVLVDYGRQKFSFLLETAKPIPVSGIFDVNDVEDKLDELYYNGLRRGSSTGFATLDEYYTVVPGQWTVVTGIPGHGKSNVLDGIMVNLAKHSDWRFGIFSPENQPIARHFASIMEKYHEAPFDVGRPGRITEEQKEEGKLWLKKHFSIILPDEDDSWSIDGVLEKAKVLVYRRGMKGLVIDPWNELDHSRPSNQTETEYISSALTKLRQFARNYDVHVWLVAHPAKLYKDKDGKYPVPTPYDISGSAHYRNKADNAITVWRNVGHEDQTVADVHIQKIRFKEVGKVGLCSLRFDPVSGCFIDDIDQSKRRNALEEGIVIPTDKLRRGLY